MKFLFRRKKIFTVRVGMVFCRGQKKLIRKVNFDFQMFCHSRIPKRKPKCWYIWINLYESKPNSLDEQKCLTCYRICTMGGRWIKPFYPRKTGSSSSGLATIGIHPAWKWTKCCTGNSSIQSPGRIGSLETKGKVAFVQSSQSSLLRIRFLIMP